MIIDVHTPNNPNFVGHFKTPAFAQSMEVVNNFAYITDSWDWRGLLIIDVSNLTNPRPRGRIGSGSPEPGEDVRVVNNIAYIAYGKSGIQAIDVINPDSPVLRGSFDTAGEAMDIDIVGNLAYIADGSDGLQILDVSDPSNITLRGSFDTPGNAFGVQVVGTLAYVADGTSGLHIVDVSNPANPTLHGSAGMNSNNGVAQDVVVLNERAYIAGGNSGLEMTV